MIEMIVVVAIGAILLSMAIGGFGEATSGLAVQNARQSFSALQSRARAYAIERGTLARLHADPAGDSAWVESGGDRIDFVNFDESRGVDVQSGATGLITLCLNPRGFGETSCNSFGSGTVDISFVQGAATASVTILPLGQLEW